MKPSNEDTLLHEVVRDTHPPDCVPAKAVIQVRRWSTIEEDPEYGHDEIVVLGGGTGHVGNAIETPRNPEDLKRLARDLRTVAAFVDGLADAMR